MMDIILQKGGETRKKEEENLNFGTLTVECGV